MDKTKKSKAEKLQTKLEKLLQTKEKRQAAFDKAKQELIAVSKEVESVKLKLFEILQNGSDDVSFSNWAKRKIGESGNSAKSGNSNSTKNENADSAKNDNANSSKSAKPVPQNSQPHTGQNYQPPAQQNLQPRTSQTQPPRQ